MKCLAMRRAPPKLEHVRTSSNPHSCHHSSASSSSASSSLRCPSCQSPPRPPGSSPPGIQAFRMQSSSRATTPVPQGISGDLLASQGAKRPTSRVPTPMPQGISRDLKASQGISGCHTPRVQGHNSRAIGDLRGSQGAKHRGSRARDSRATGCHRIPQGAMDFAIVARF